MNKGPSRRALRAASPWAAAAALLGITLQRCWGGGPVPDAGAPLAQRPAVVGSTSGVPVVQITAPNAAGLSVNKFRDFSFRHGLVLNNSAAGGRSLSAGRLPGNPRLAAGEAAKLGLMEVTGGVPSRLAGTLEVFGKRMAVFVANPDGITVGAGATGLATLNVSRLSLSTGVPRIGADGRLLGLRVQRGSIRTQGSGGVNTDGLDYFGLQALSVRLNAPVGSNHSTRLQVVAGPSWLDARSGAVRPLHGPAQGFGISASALGSMRGDQIELISTGAGVGVTHRGVITAAADLSLSADGDLRLNRAASSAGRVQLSTPSQLRLDGELRGRSVSVAAGSLRNDGSVQAGRRLLIDTAGDVDNRQVLASGGRLVVHAGGRLRNSPGAAMLAMGRLELHAGQRLDNGSDALLQSQDDLVLAAPEVRNEPGARVSAQRNLEVYADTLDNQARLRGDIEAGPLQTAHGSYTDPHAGVLRFDIYRLELQGPTLHPTLEQTAPAVLQAGGRIGVHGAGHAATVHNHGRMMAGGNVRIDGSLHNGQIERDVDLVSYLQHTGAMSMHVSPRNSTFHTPLASTGDFRFASLYDFLDGMFGRNAANAYDGRLYHYGYDKAIAALASLDLRAAPMLQQVLAQALGSGWRDQSFATLQAQWRRFKAQPPVLRFLAANPGQVVSGADLRQAGGALFNGSLAPMPGPQRMSTRVGTQALATVQGEVASRTGAAASLDAPDTLAELASLHPMLLRRDPRSEGGGVQPLYRSRLRVVDQRSFHGLPDLLGLLGVHDTGTSRATLLDNYLTELVLQRELSRAGVDALLTERYAVGASGLVWQLMDNAARQAPMLGLVLGSSPSEQQMARLAAPMVWYVSRDVAGQQVLVPELYLDRATLAAARERRQGGAWLSAASTLSADASRIDNVDGTIEAGQAVRLHSATALNNLAAAGLGERGIHSPGGSVRLQAGGDLLDRGAQVSGRRVDVRAGGTLSVADSVGLDPGGASVAQGVQWAASQHMQLVAGRDIVLQAASLQGHDLRLSAQGSIRSDTLALASSTASSQLRTGAWGHSIRNAGSVAVGRQGSRLAAAADGLLSLHAAGDVRLTGGRYSAGQADLQAGGSLRLRAARQDAAAHESVSSLSWSGTAGTALGSRSYTADWNSDSGWKLAARDHDAAPDAASVFQGSSAPPRSQVGAARFGLQWMHTSASERTTRYTLAVLEAADGLRLASGHSTDIGGADLSAGGALSVLGQRVLTTKPRDRSMRSSDTSSFHIGVQGDLSSAVQQTVNDVAAQLQQQGSGSAQGASEAWLQAASQAGDASAVLFGTLVNAVGGFGFGASHEHWSLHSSVEPISHLRAARMSITSTGGDIELRGVQADSQDLSLRSAGAIGLRAARSSLLEQGRSRSWSLSQQANVQVGGVAREFASGVGLSLGAGFSHASASRQESHHSATVLRATRARVDAAGVIGLRGAELLARQVDLRAGSLDMASPQDTVRVGQHAGGFNLSIGVALSDRLVASPMGGIGMSAGSASLRSRTVAQPSGIRTDGRFDAKVQGDARLSGAWLRGGDGSTLQLGGRLAAESLQDSASIASRQGGFSAGMGANGSAYGSVTAGRGPGQELRATRDAAVVGIRLAARGGVQGPLSATDPSQGVPVLNHRVAGSTSTFNAARLPKRLDPPAAAPAAPEPVAPEVPLAAEQP